MMIDKNHMHNSVEIKGNLFCEVNIFTPIESQSHYANEN